MPAAAPIGLAAASEGDEQTDEPSDGSNVVIHVKSYTGAPLSEIKVTGGRVGGYVNTLGYTGTDGKLRLTLAPGEYNFTATYRNTSQTKRVTVGENRITVEFQTSEVRIKAEDSNGAPLEGVTLRFKAGGYTSHWGKATGTDGITTGELFAGTYEFEASYNNTTVGFVGVDITGDGVDHTFTATLVTLSYPGNIRYKGSAGYMHHFEKPTMALFPGTYEFTFSGGGMPSSHSAFVCACATSTGRSASSPRP